MGLLDAGGSGWCLRWSATASRVVYDGQHGRYSLVSARGSGDGGEVLKGSRFPGCCSRQLGLPPHGTPRDKSNYRAANECTARRTRGTDPAGAPAGPRRRLCPARPGSHIYVLWNLADVTQGVQRQHLVSIQGDRGAAVSCHSSSANSQGWPAGMAARICRTCSGVQ